MRMPKRIIAGRLLLVGIAYLVFASSCSVASDYYEDNSKTPNINKSNYFYGNSNDGPICYGPKGAVSAPPVGAVVKNLPIGYKTVLSLGSPELLYSYKKTFFKASSKGFIVVSSPAAEETVKYPSVHAAPVAPASHAAPAAYSGAAARPQTITAASDVVNVPNSDGTFTPIKLIKHGDGYTGPQGEFYPGHPTINQLKTLYGK